jgi:hypothetical protein
MHTELANHTKLAMHTELANHTKLANHTNRPHFGCIDHALPLLHSERHAWQESQMATVGRLGCLVGGCLIVDFTQQATEPSRFDTQAKPLRGRG